jgi:hypothetical protein
MIHLTWLPDYFQAAVWIYMLLWLVATAYVLVKPTSTTQRRVINTIFVTMAFGLLPTYCSQHAKQYEEKQAPIVQQQQAQLQAAMTRFEELCKTAGEKITRTVQSVDGIVLMKGRSRNLNSGQFNLDDPYGKDCIVNGCIVNLLRASEGLDKFPESAKRYANGYQFVEMLDRRDGLLYRYTGALRHVSARNSGKSGEYEEDTGYGGHADGSYFALRRTKIEKSSARYGVDWEDVSTREDREFWIAGGSLKVIDLQTKEVIAERLGYLIDRGQGSKAGFRDPWAFAQTSGDSCPKLVDEQGNATRVGFTKRFVNKVAQPVKKEE